MSKTLSVLVLALSLTGAAAFAEGTTTTTGAAGTDTTTTAPKDAMKPHAKKMAKAGKKHKKDKKAEATTGN